MSKPLTNNYESLVEALVTALLLAARAKWGDQLAGVEVDEAERAITLAKHCAIGLSEADVERAKAEATERAASLEVAAIMSGEAQK